MTTGVYLRPEHLYGNIAFDSRYEPVTETGCWLWTSYTNGVGYGRLRPYQNSGMVYAHRYSYTRFKGSIPEGMQVCHKCDTPSCVNPEHLFLGTRSDNMADCQNKGRNNKGKSRLAIEDIRDILTSKLSQRTLARKYKVSQSMIWKLKADKIEAARRVL